MARRSPPVVVSGGGREAVGSSFGAESVVPDVPGTARTSGDSALPAAEGAAADAAALLGERAEESWGVHGQKSQPSSSACAVAASATCLAEAKESPAMPAVSVEPSAGSIRMNAPVVRDTS